MKLNKYVLALSCAFATLAHADGNWYVLGSAGVTRGDLDKSKLDKELKSDGVVVKSSDIDETDTGYKVQVGYQFTENFAVEGGYTDLGEIDYKAKVGTGGKDKFSWEASGVNLDVLALAPLTDALSVFAKFGVINAKVEAKFDPQSGRSESDDNTKLKTIFGFGAQYAVLSNLLLRAEVESYNSLGDDGSTGESDVYLFSGGVAYKF